MDTDMTDDLLLKYLNYDCLEHIVKYLTPKDWIKFSPDSAISNIVSLSKDVQELRYIVLYGSRNENPDVERLEFSEFMEIFKLVAPNIKYAKFKRFRVSPSVCQGNPGASVKFGRFEYIIEVINNEEEELVVETCLKEAKNVKKLDVNAFNGGTTLEWDQFFQANPLEYFRFLAQRQLECDSFFKDIISIIPNKIQKIGLCFWVYELTGEQDEQIIQLLQKLPLLTKVRIYRKDDLCPKVATSIGYHAHTVKDLWIEHRQSDYHKENYIEDIEQTTEILEIIPKCVNLTELILAGFTLHDDVCRQIAANCQSIQCLNLTGSRVSAASLQMLMSLPNLIELQIHPKVMTFRAEIRNLKKLAVAKFDDPFDAENLAHSLSFMPNLSSLILQFEDLLTEPAVRIIKRIVKSRGQNIGLYHLNRNFGTFEFDIKKIGNVVLVPGSNIEFAIFVRILERTRQPLLLEMLKSDKE